MSSKTRRSIGIVITLLLAFLFIDPAWTASPSVSSAHEAVTSTKTFVGTWTGQGIQNGNSFDIKLTIEASQVSGNTFSGIVSEDNNTVNVKGVFNSQRRTFALMFVSNVNISTTGSFIPVVYSGYILNGTTIKGIWIVPPTPPSSSQNLVGNQGTISLTKQL